MLREDERERKEKEKPYDFRSVDIIIMSTVGC
jgi:hypothetical protein